MGDITLCLSFGKSSLSFRQMEEYSYISSSQQNTNTTFSGYQIIGARFSDPKELLNQKKNRPKIVFGFHSSSHVSCFFVFLTV